MDLRSARAARRRSRGDAKGAESNFVAAVTLAPEQAALHVGLSRVFRAQKQGAERRHRRRGGHEARPRGCVRLAPLGDLRWLLAHDGPAVEALTRAVRYAPDSFAAHAGLAAARVRVGDPEGAVVELTRAAEIRPDARRCTPTSHVCTKLPTAPPRPSPHSSACGIFVP